MATLKKLHPVWGAGDFIRKPAGLKFDRILTGWAHWCPGCGTVHVLRLRDYHFDGERTETPTVSPAVTHPIAAKQLHHCAYVIANGRIQYGRDCTHRFAGRDFELPPWSVTAAGVPTLPRELLSMFCPS